MTQVSNEEKKDTRKIYYISINCPGHSIVKVKGANDEVDAIEAAEKSFQCEETRGEYNEMLNINYGYDEEVEL